MHSPSHSSFQPSSANSGASAPGTPGVSAGASRPSVPLYLTAFVVTACGLFSVSEYLADDAFTRLIFGLAILGFIVSYVSRLQNVSPRNIELPALIICGCVIFMGILSDQPFLAPASVGDDRHRFLAVLLTWLTVFRSYTLINDGALMFCCVPTLAMIGLISTNMTDGTVLYSFVLFVAAAAFMMVHENFLRTRSAAGAPRRTRSQRMMFGSQIQVAGLCVAGSLLIANILVVPLRTVLNQLQVSAGLPTITRASSTTTTVSTLQVKEAAEVAIGTGPVSPSDTILMRVKSDFESYWRGTTFDHYTGHGWRNTLPAEQQLRLDPAAPIPDTRPSGRESLDTGPAYTFAVPPTSVSEVGGAHHIHRQVITLQGASFTELYAASEPRRLLMSQSQGMVDAAGTIHLSTMVPALEYAVDSDVAEAKPADLKRTDTDYPEQIRQLYLQMMDNSAIAAQVRKTAEEVTRGLKSSYDKAQALNQWLGNECKYNLKSPAVPSGEDVVSYFLYTQKQGYCDSFAAAMTMLCRSIGIPARVASGFLTGEPDPFKHEYIVRERDKHQWTEVYFNHVGWVRFDATEFAENITPENETSVSKQQSVLGLIFGRGWLPPVALAAFIAMLAYVVKVELIDRLRALRSQPNPLGLPDSNLRVLASYDSACSRLARRGMKRALSETAGEFAARGARVLSSEALAELNALTTLVADARYSGRVITSDEVSRAAGHVAALEASLRSGRLHSLNLPPAPDGSRA